MKPKVSVIIPVYNVENYIVKCVDSVVNQTLKDIEIIVIDDGSIDDSIKKIENRYSDNRLKIFRKTNGGQASARNYGISKAKGEYLLFIDSDDFVSKNMIEKMYNRVIEKDVDLVICDYYKLEENGNKEHIEMIPFYDKNNKNISVISMPGPVCKLIKSSIFTKNSIKFLENYIFEDNAVMPLVCALCNDFEYINEPYYYYLQRTGSSLNTKKYNKKWEDIFISLDFLYNSFKNNKILNKFYCEIEFIYIEYLLHAANLRFLDYKEGYKNIKRVSNIIYEKFPNWRKNKYYKKENLKYKIICNLFYYNKLHIIKFLLRR